MPQRRCHGVGHLQDRNVLSYNSGAAEVIQGHPPGHPGWRQVVTPGDSQMILGGILQNISSSMRGTKESDPQQSCPWPKLISTHPVPHSSFYLKLKGPKYKYTYMLTMISSLVDLWVFPSFLSFLSSFFLFIFFLSDRFWLWLT